MFNVSWCEVVRWCNSRSENDGLAARFFTDDTQTEVYRGGDKDIGNDMVKWNAATACPQRRSGRGQRGVVWSASESRVP